MRVRQTRHYVIFFQFSVKSVAPLGVGMCTHKAKLPLSYQDLEFIIDDLKHTGGYENVVITGFQEVRRDKNSTK